MLTYEVDFFLSSAIIQHVFIQPMPDARDILLNKKDMDPALMMLPD